MTRTLIVEFIKVTDRSCVARARRLDGAMIETTATARDGLPHDLELLVVEAALDCGNGFWGRVWRGAEFDSIRVVSSGPRRRARSWNRQLTKGYNGWNEDLVTKVVAVLDEAAGRGWSPPAHCPTCRPWRSCSTSGAVPQRRPSSTGTGSPLR